MSDQWPTVVEMPPDVRAQVKSMVDGVAKVARREAEIAADDAEWARIKGEILRNPTSPKALGWCAGTGKEAVKRDGHLVCPDCGEPLVLRPRVAK